jgi:hypothetical protein
MHLFLVSYTPLAGHLLTEWHLRPPHQLLMDLTHTCLDSSLQVLLYLGRALPHCRLIWLERWQHCLEVLLASRCDHMYAIFWPALCRACPNLMSRQLQGILPVVKGTLCPTLLRGTRGMYRELRSPGACWEFQGRCWSVPTICTPWGKDIDLSCK